MWKNQNSKKIEPNRKNQAKTELNRKNQAKTGKNRVKPVFALKK